MSGYESSPNRIFLISRRREALKADLPPDLIGGYYIDGRTRPGLGFYLDRQSHRPVIRDMGRALDTWQSDTATVGDMLKVARHRGWMSVQVRGEVRFRQAAWRLGQAQGLDVRGYHPSERDLAWLAEHKVPERKPAEPHPAAAARRLLARVEERSSRWAPLRAAETLSAVKVASPEAGRQLLDGVRVRSQALTQPPPREAAAKMTPMKTKKKDRDR